MQILLIDDDLNFLDELKERLTKYGYIVQIAGDGETAWDLFSKAPTEYDVIISDIKMPVLGGVELLKRLRYYEYDVPVIIMTGHGDLNISIEALKHGAYNFLLKPFSLKDLRKTLSKLVAQQIPKKQLYEFYEGLKEELTITINTNTDSIPTLAQHLESHYQIPCKMFNINVHNITLCLHEALNNAVIHGNLEVPSTLKEQSFETFMNKVKEREAKQEYAHRLIKITFRMENLRMIFEVQDQGHGFEFEKLPSHENPDSLLLSGRGLLLIRASMDEVSWDQHSKCLKMVKYLERPQ
ncbi:response regulator [Deltaproteobacteria bacterium TL4]